MADAIEVLPSARRLIDSLRDVGYTTVEAIADVVDNSVAAEARRVDITLRVEGSEPYIRIVDDGTGMNGTQITEAMRYGANRKYADDDLGKFGLGLKTASMSQCRCLSVASRTNQDRARMEARQLDLDHIERTDRWEILVVPSAERPDVLVDPLREHTGTVVLWQDLDRTLPYKDPTGGWARNRLIKIAAEVDEHLGMVFHRFLSGQVPGHDLNITINGTAIEPWDPFATAETHTKTLDAQTIEMSSPNGAGLVRIDPFVLPPQHRFSSTSAWSAASGPRSWNRQQGFYIYRANRLIQSGGWSNTRTLDEHNKLARIGLSFSPDLDDVFDINVAKMRVSLPAELREQLEPIVRQTIRHAQAVYRAKDPAKTRPAPAPRPKGASPGPGPSGPTPTPPAGPAPSPTATPTGPPAAPNGGHAPATPIRTALERAAEAAGVLDELDAIIRELNDQDPEVARELGW